MSEIYLKEAKISLSDNLDSVLCLDKSGNQILIFDEKNGGYVGYVTDKTFGDYRDFSFSPKENEIVKNACNNKSGKTTVLTILDDEMMLYIFGVDGEISQALNIGRLEFDYSQ